MYTFFDDWKRPEPQTWTKGYQDKPHVKAINERINQYQDGLLTIREMILFITHEYEMAYLAGEEEARFLCPAIKY